MGILLSCQQVADKTRFEEVLFDEIKRETHLYSIKGADSLKMDMLYPENDTLSDRPVVLYVHGGGFSGGRRDDSLHLAFCENLARRGFVAVTMSYRLIMRGKSFHCDQPAPNKIAAFRSVADDIEDATAYLIKKAAQLHIDPQRVILIGSSAGAEAVLHRVYGTYEVGSRYRKLPSSYQYAGVISLAGAIVDIEQIQKKTAIPTQLFHGTCDQLVPYGTAAHHYCDSSEVGYLLLYGPQAIANRLQKLDKGYYFHTTCGGGHELASLPLSQYLDKIVDFIYQDVLNQQSRRINEQTRRDNPVCENIPSPSVCLDS